jgi:outer membrane protein assembly factor BamB
MKLSVLFPACFLATTLTASAANWPGFRGPNHDGSSPETGLPEKFSKTEGVKWAAAMPGPAASVPAIWGDHVFVSSSNPETQKLMAMCLDARTGQVKWQHEVTDGYQHDDRSNLASPSPCTDGEHAFFLYGTSMLVAYDFSGKEVWKRDLGKDYGNFGTQWTYSSSPVLDGGRLHIQVLQRNVAFEFHGLQKGDPDGKNESYILALEPKTGKEVWKVVRPSDAQAESLEGFSSPVFHTHNGKRIMLISGGDTLTSHDAATGAEQWRMESYNPGKIGHWRHVPSPVAGEGIALVCAPKKEPVYALKLENSGTVKPVWTSDSREVSSDVSTPLFYQGKFYVLDSDRKALACVEPKTGKVIWRGEFPTRVKMEASPTGADGKIYTVDFLGNVFVVKAGGDAFEIVHQATFGEEGRTATNNDKICRAGIAVADGKLYIRAQDRLYCIGK